MNLRVKIWKDKYLLWDNEGLAFGEDTASEDLWNDGYEMKAFGYKYFGRVVAIIATKRKASLDYGFLLADSYSIKCNVCKEMILKGGHVQCIGDPHKK